MTMTTTASTHAPPPGFGGMTTLTTSMEAGVSELCHYPPLIHSCGSRGSSCCAATVSTSNDVSSSSKAWSHMYSQRKSNCSRRTQCASLAYSTNGISSFSYVGVMQYQLGAY